MNNGELSHYEMVNSFSLADEQKCLFMFIQSITAQTDHCQCIQKHHFYFLKG